MNFRKSFDNGIYIKAFGDYLFIEQKGLDNQDYLIPIFEKYSGRFPEFFEVQNYNDLLKQSAFKAGLNRKLRFRYEYANAEGATEKRVEIHKKISNSRARNCVVSILC